MKDYRKYLLFQARHGAVDAPRYAWELSQRVAPDRARWRTYVTVGLLALGLGLLTCGLVFLLAFNWEALNKWQKLGLATAGVAIPTVLSVTHLFSPFVRKCLVTTAAFMVGGLFAVFGQIYQTGADNYEYFLAWWLFITLWAFAVDFPALWLIWLTVANLTLYFYGEQVLDRWQTYETLGLQVVVTGLTLVGLALYSRKRPNPYPTWLLNALALAVASLSVVAILLTSWRDRPDAVYDLVRFGVLAILLLGLFLGYRQKWLGLLAAMSLAVIASVAILILAFNDDTGFILLATLWSLGATTAAVISLNVLRKHWLEERVADPITMNPGADAGAVEWERRAETTPVGPPSNPVTDAAPESEPQGAARSPLLQEYLAVEQERPPFGLQLLGMLGGLFPMVAFLSFLALIGLLDESLGRASLGALLLVGGIAIDRGSQGNFLGALIVSAVTSGLLLLISYSLEVDGLAFWQVSLGLAALCAITLVLARSAALQTLMVIGVHFCTLAAMLDERITWYPARGYVLALGLFFSFWVFREAYIATISAFWADRYEAIRTGSMVGLIGGALFVRWVGYFDGDNYYYVYGFPFLEWLLIPALYAGYLAIRKYYAGTRWVVLYTAGLALLLFPFSFAPASAPALLILLVSLKSGYRLGITLGAVALLYFVGQYYYDLNTSLLDKSLLLAATGLFYLIAYAVTRKSITSNEGVY